MVDSPDSSPRRRQQRDLSPSRNTSPSTRHLGSTSLSRAAGAYANASIPAARAMQMSPDIGSSSRIPPEYFGNGYYGRPTQNVPAAPYASMSPNRASPSIHPGAGNSFASTATTSTATTNGRATSVSTGGRRQSSVQSTRTNATHGTSASFSTDSSRVSHAATSSELEGAQKKKKGPWQKDILAKALQKANDAVLLDNDSDMAGAIDAYQEACALLEKVMSRTSVPEDRQKLESIRSTYIGRITELRASFEPSDDDVDGLLGAEHAYMQEGAATYIVGGERHTDLYDSNLAEDEHGASSHSRTGAGHLHRPPVHSRQGHSPAQNGTSTQNGHAPQSRNAWQQQQQNYQQYQQSTERQPPPANLPLPRIPAMDESVIPAPLSPWRTTAPSRPEGSDTMNTPQTSTLSVSDTRTVGQERGHSRQETAESTSWLDTIDESGDSTSSAHSRSSSMHDTTDRRYLVRRSGNTVAAFDLALEYAIEAAYDDGGDDYEVTADEHYRQYDEDDLYVFESGRIEGVGERPIPSAIEGQRPSDIQQKVQAAKERVRRAAREDEWVKREIEQRSGRATPAGRMTPAGRQTPAPPVNELYEESELQDEDNILTAMHEYTHTAPALPPTPFQAEFDIGSTRNVWTSPGSSTDVNATTTVHRASTPDVIRPAPSTIPFESLSGRPPSITLPELPFTGGTKRPSPVITPPASAATLSAFAPTIISPGIRERRLSDRKIGSLTIDTGTKLDASQQGPKTIGVPARLSPIKQLDIHEGPRSAVEADKSFAAQMDEGRGRVLAAPLMFETGPGTESASPHASMFTRTPLSEPKSAQPSVPASPARSRPGTASGLRKNFSSSSLKSLRHMVGTPTTADDSPQTPMTRIFSSGSQPGHGSVPSVPELPTSAAASFLRHGLGPGSLSYLNVDIHSLATPGSPNPAIPNGPAPLEPCPESFLLRPFWLLRCVYQIISNPHGGYLSQKLFVPRDVWLVRNVKIRNIDEKVSQCDLLTAALLKLARSDMDDADAVLEEMQSFELILDQVQTTLQKRLGAEVGLQGAVALFKANSAHDDSHGAGGSGSNGHTNAASTATSRISSSIRRFRNRNMSTPGVPNAGSSYIPSRDARDTLTLRSLPMAPSTTVPKKTAKRDATKILGIGPHANYMASLARLSDAAQILDQVARQVEDPGLRLSSQTHVGLELCTRHAAEFFAFFICRFAINDIAAMLDKFVKRGGEWIMS